MKLKPRFVSSEFASSSPDEPQVPGRLVAVDGEGAEVIDLMTLETGEVSHPHWPPPHVVSVSRHPDFIDTELSEYDVRCSCNWPGALFSHVDDPETDVMMLMAEAWLEHLRMSNRVFHLAKKIRRQRQTAGVS